jgi:hypothetical protein
VVSAKGPDGLQARFFRPEPLHFIPSSSFILTSLRGPLSRPTATQNGIDPGTSGSAARNSDH